MELKFKKVLLLLLLCFFFSIEARCVDLPQDLKNFLINKFPGINLKIDNSFVLNNETFLPLVPEATKTSDNIEILDVVIDDITPKLFWFSNNWVFVKVLKRPDGTKSILSLKEVPEQYKEKFLKSKLPDDLVVPESFVLDTEVLSIKGELNIKTKLEESVKKTEEKKLIQSPGLKGLLYLTSPDTGKIVYVDLKDLTKIYHIQTMGTPWAIALDKTNDFLFVTDFAKDQIYQFKPLATNITKTFNLLAMSSPKDIKLSDDGSLAYLLESVASDFAVYETKEEKYFIKTKLPQNPSSFSLIKEANLIAIACPNANSLVFLNTNDYSISGQIMIDGGPEKIISDPNRLIIYTTNRNGNTISEINLETKSVIKTIAVGETPVSLALHPGGKWLYVANGKSNSINIVDLETSQIADTINLPIETQFPGDVKLTSDSKWLIVPSETTNTITIIDLSLKKVAVKLDVGATTHSAFIFDK